MCVCEEKLKTYIFYLLRTSDGTRLVPELSRRNTMIIWRVRWWGQSGFIYISVLLSAPIRERRPAFCVCQKAALWCTCAGRVLSRGCADLWRATPRCQRRLDGTASLEIGSRKPRRPLRLLYPAVEIPIHFVASEVQLYICTGMILL